MFLDQHKSNSIQSHRCRCCCVVILLTHIYKVSLKCSPLSTSYLGYFSSFSFLLQNWPTIDFHGGGQATKATLSFLGGLVERCLRNMYFFLNMKWCAMMRLIFNNIEKLIFTNSLLFRCITNDRNVYAIENKLRNL